MDFRDFVQLSEKIKFLEFNPTIAHYEIAPFRNQSLPQKTLQHRDAGVLILIYPKQNISHFALIERPIYNGQHSGQIALPGGKVEQEDENIIATALREAYEETNIHPNQVEIIKPLSQIFIPPSNFFVTPVLGLANETPHFIPEKREVKLILEVNLNDLLTNNNFKKRNLSTQNGFKINAPSFELNEKIVWGATAMMLNELKHIIHELTT